MALRVEGAPLQSASSSVSEVYKKKRVREKGYTGRSVSRRAILAGAGLGCLRGPPLGKGQLDRSGF